MDLHFTADELAFRAEVAAFVKQNLPTDLRQKMLLGQHVGRHDLTPWQRILNAKGWAVPHWPVEWGGTGWSATQLYLYKDVLHRTPAPESHSVSINLIGGALVAFGSDEQKRRFLPRIANLDEMWCQGFSEPNAGSDLASLQTMAIQDGDEYVVNGQKIWTSFAHEADWMFALVRTSREAKKQSGISFLMIDMKTPGLTIRPIEQIDGGRHLNEVFFTDVRVPVANRLGEENKGWQYARNLLGNERTGIARVGPITYQVLQAKHLASEVSAGGHRLIDEPRLRERIAQAEVMLKALEITQLRIVAEQQKAKLAGEKASGEADPAASILKVAGTELYQQCTELLFDIAGHEGLPFQPEVIEGHAEAALGSPWAAALGPTYLLQRAASIYAGSNEIQRNIIARNVLGL